MSDDDAIIRKFQIRALTPNAGYCVRRSEEEMRSLQKENLNLKLKVYFLENKYGYSTKMPSEVSNIYDKEFIDIFLENESLKTELKEKKDLMTNALAAIEQLERQKDEQVRESKVMIEDYLKRIESLKVRSKMNKRKMSKKQPPPNVIQNSLISQELEILRSQNADLATRMNELKKENANKCCVLEKLSAEKYNLLEKIDEIERNLNIKDNIIASLTEKLNENSMDYNLAVLLEENKDLRTNIEELLAKCGKIEKECKDYQRIVKEQSEIMKGLNRTVEAKNDELDDYKAKLKFNNASFIQDKEINLNSESTSVCNLQFHNPLFGSIQSLDS